MPVLLFIRPSLQESGPFAHPPCSELLLDHCGGMQPELSLLLYLRLYFTLKPYGRHVEEAQCSLRGIFTPILLYGFPTQFT